MTSIMYATRELINFAAKHNLPIRRVHEYAQRAAKAGIVNIRWENMHPEDVMGIPYYDSEGNRLTAKEYFMKGEK